MEPLQFLNTCRHCVNTYKWGWFAITIGIMKIPVGIGPSTDIILAGEDTFRVLTWLAVNKNRSLAYWAIQFHIEVKLSFKIWLQTYTNSSMIRAQIHQLYFSNSNKYHELLPNFWNQASPEFWQRSLQEGFHGY